MQNICKLNFNDFYLSKYTYIGEFHEGLAVVKNRDDLFGYINKKGEEVIPCQFKAADNFSEGLAAVQNNQDHLWGYINKKGKEVITYEYKNAANFREGLACVELSDNTYKYIYKDGSNLNEERYKQAYGFSDGYAVVERLGNPGRALIDANGRMCEVYPSITSFYDGLALVARVSEYQLIDTNLEIVARNSNDDIQSIQMTGESGLMPVKNNQDKFGYYDKKLTKQIPFIFKDATTFNEGLARVELSPEWHGYIDSAGKVVLTFSKKSQYKELSDFHDGLAKVCIPYYENGYGYINKKGEEVISCQYRDADNFSEGLAGVYSIDRRFYYIDKKGNIKISIPVVYYSVLELDDKIITIEAQTKEELEAKKLQVLSLLKTQLLSQITNEIEQLAYEHTSELVESVLTKTRKPNK